MATTFTKEELAKLPADLRKRFEAVVSENELLHKVAEGRLSLKVSEKGAVSLYGTGRWPVTLYKEQWNRVLDFGPTIREFIAANDSKLKTKLQAVATGDGEGANGAANGNGNGNAAK